jgi:RHS repeat-associated protein
MTHVLGETLGSAGDPQALCPYQTVTFAREFRYDTGRARYLNRELDPVTLGGTGLYITLSETWSDYDGDEIYGDFTVDTMGADTDVRSFEPGLGTVDPWEEEGADSTTYVHSDHLGTLREASGDAGASLRVFTAFGEPITSQADRYGYVGAWGYQSNDGFPYQHVGARYYAPSTGRFVQRDPIGIVGGTNAYVYVASLPTALVDPKGLFTGVELAPAPGLPGIEVVDDDNDPVVHPSPSPPLPERPPPGWSDVGGLGPGLQESAKRAGKYCIVGVSVGCRTKDWKVGVITAGTVACVDLWLDLTEWLGW